MRSELEVVMGFPEGGVVRGCVVGEVWSEGRCGWREVWSRDHDNTGLQKVAPARTSDFKSLSSASLLMSALRERRLKLTLSVDTDTNASIPSSDLSLL